MSSNPLHPGLSNTPKTVPGLTVGGGCGSPATTSASSVGEVTDSNYVDRNSSVVGFLVKRQEESECL